MAITTQPTAAEGGAMILPSDQEASGRTLGMEEVARVTEAIRSGTLTSTKGRFTRDFETRFAALCGAKHAWACASGSAAMHVALAAIDPEPGEARRRRRVHHRMTGLADPGVGDARHVAPGSGRQLAPEVVRGCVPLAVLVEIGAHPRAKLVGAEVALDHANHAGNISHAGADQRCGSDIVLLLQIVTTQAVLQGRKSSANRNSDLRYQRLWYRTTRLL